MKKKILFATILGICIVFVIAGSAFAATTWSGRHGGDGLCNHCGANACLGDVDGDGICDYCGANACLGDVDGDGICDYWDNRLRDGNGRQNGQNQQANLSYGQHNGCHNGKHF